MPTKKEQPVKTYEVGVKNRKPFVVRADKFNGAAFDGDLKFSLKGELLYVIHRHKWDYVRLVGEGESDPLLDALGESRRALLTAITSEDGLDGGEGMKVVRRIEDLLRSHGRRVEVITEEAHASR
jgi:hypothetical protein